MEKIQVDGLDLFFDEGERNAAELIGQACRRTKHLVHEVWGLETPKDCRVYVMTSWLHFLFHSAPWSWRFLLVSTWPFWYFRIKKLWDYAGGWEQRYGQRRAVGVKPPRLMAASIPSIGEQIFVKEGNLNDKVQTVTCHELTHAFSSHLNLPSWLKEGLAMVTVDRFSEKATVQQGTLDLLERWTDKAGYGGIQKIRLERQDAAIYLYVRGYWLTRWVEDVRPGLLRELLSKRYGEGVVERRLASAFGLGLEEFWRNVDGLVVAHFKHEEKPNEPIPLTVPAIGNGP
jgi:hypothetical protein